MINNDGAPATKGDLRVFGKELKTEILTEVKVMNIELKKEILEGVAINNATLEKRLKQEITKEVLEGVMFINENLVADMRGAHKDDIEVVKDKVRGHDRRLKRIETKLNLAA